MTDLPFTVVDQPTGFEIHVDPTLVAEALRARGWTVFPPVSAEDALALMEPQSIVVEGWQGYTQRSWRGADQSKTLVPEPVARDGQFSFRAAARVEAADGPTFRAGSQPYRLLAVYASTVKGGLTDEEAARAAGLLGSCYWKRTGDLRKHAMIAFARVNGVPVKRVGSAGSLRHVCVITDVGRAYLSGVTEPE